MEHSDKKFNVLLADEETPHVINFREGELAPIREPKINKHKGDILSPGKYHTVRPCDPQKAIILFSRYADNPWISLIIDDKDYFADNIEGELLANKELNVFRLNTGDTFSLADLGKLILRSRYLFPDKDQNASIVRELNSFKGTVQTELEKEQSNRGNKRELIDKKVVSGLPMEFKLEAPVYIGFSAKTFRVEICYDVTDAGVRIWLDSPELIEIMKVERDSIINTELSKFAGFVQIEK